MVKLEQWLFRLIVLSALSVVTGCTVSSGEIDSVFDRRLQWADFISAGDIRRGCEVGTKDSVRFVLNSDRSQQVRIYDLDLETKSLRIRIVDGKLDFAGVQLRIDIISAWKPQDVRTRLSNRDITRLMKTYAQDELASSNSAPKDLLSEWHFWLVGTCRNGVFNLRHWVYPDADYRALKFPQLLFRWDQSGAELVTPPSFGRKSAREDNSARAAGFPHYQLHVRKNSVVLGQPYGLDRSR